MPAVELRNISKIFDGNLAAVDDVSLGVAAGEFMVLLGPSGCGKSTLLRIIAGLEEPSSGEVLLDGAVANHLAPRERGVAMVFQSFALYPHLKAGGNIGFPLRISGVEPRERLERSAHMAAALGIGDLLDRSPQQLSGGQRQRVAMGRALVRRPSILLMDEPLSNLDVGLRSELRSEIGELTKRLGVTTVYVTHDQTEALTMADRIAVLRRGRLQDVGTPRDIYDKPATAYVASFLGTPRMSLIEAVVEVQLERYVGLRLGDQQLRLPWGNLTSRAVARYHGEHVIVGLRAEALHISPASTGQTLHGEVRAMEHHGHESLVHLGIGASAIGIEEPAEPPAAQVRRPGRRLRRHSGPEPAPAGRHSRKPAELAVRTAPYVRYAPGQRVAVQVHTEALHFFDDSGNRIAAGPRR